MSWLNSLSTIKGQLTTLAQEVLAETAGPGDEEYRGPEVNKQTAIELLAQTQQEKEQLDVQCNKQEILIASLRKQINELQDKVSDSGGGRTTKDAAVGGTIQTTQNLSDESNAVLEDSWCWEPDNTKHNNESNTSKDEAHANFKLETVPLGPGTPMTIDSTRTENAADLKLRISQLEDENRQLNNSIEELDTQHNVAMQNVIELKTKLQEKLSKVSKDYDDIKLQQEDRFIQNELEMAKLKINLESLKKERAKSASEKENMIQKIQNYEEELKRATNEMAELQELLEKKSHDNQELVERVKSVCIESEKIAEERAQLLQNIEQLMQEGNESEKPKEKKSSYSSTSSTSKQSEDEFIVVRESDANSSGPTTPPTKEILKDKLVQLENRVSELTLENGSLALKMQDNEAAKEQLLIALRANIDELQGKCSAYEHDLALVNEELREKEENVKELKERAAEAIIAQEQLKILTAENSNSEENISKKACALKTITELEKRLLLSEQEKEQLQLELESLRTAQDRFNKLESKIQNLTFENQQLKLNAEAEFESLNNSAELEDKLKILAAENDSLRAELTESKFSATVTKHEVTDLDAEETEEEPFKLEKARSLLEGFLRKDFDVSSDATIEKTYKILCDRLNKINSLEKNLRQMSEEIIDLQDSKLVWDHEKKTLEADISQYIIQCDELMKNNEILLNELENLKRNKLDSIPETNEENIVQLETQLEECGQLNCSLEMENAELHEKVDELDREKQQLTEKLRETQQCNAQLMQETKELQLQVDSFDLEKSNLLFEMNEFKSANEKDGDAVAELLLTKETCGNLESQLKRLNQDHANLVAALQVQKEAVLKATAKCEAAEKLVGEQEKYVPELKQEIMNSKLQTEQQSKQIKELKQELLAKDIVTETLKSELQDLQVRLTEVAELKQMKDMLSTQLIESQSLVAQLQMELDDKMSAEESLQMELHRQTRENANNFNEELKQLRIAKESLEAEHAELQQRFEKQTAELKESSVSPAALGKIAKLEAELLATAELKKTVDLLNFEKGEMIKSLQQKHAENTQYYIEIQRLNPIVQQLQQQLQEANTNATAAEKKPCQNCLTLEGTIVDLKKAQEKLQDQINFLKEKSDILTTNLLTEQTNQKFVQQEKNEVLEQNATIRKDLERLRAHLLEIEEMHTQETVEMERTLQETKAKMMALQGEVSKSSSAYTSASIRANQHAETLQAQYALIVQQRDELVHKLGLAEDRESKNQAALCNLQCALEQFQNDKENDIKVATQRIRKELQQEVAKETQLQSEITALNQQLAEANQGLLAASRLSDQLESCQQTIAVLREEVESLKERNNQLEAKLNKSESSQSDKIDKNLIKSLIIGYVVSGNPNDKNQVLRMISSVLEFTQNDSDKVGLNKQQSSWLGSILGGGGATAAGGHSKDNLVQAFVQFLEQESQPKDNTVNMPNLLNLAHISKPNAPSRHVSICSNNSDDVALPASSTQSNPIPIQPSLVNSNVLDEFTPSRNSSSILKDILSDS